MNIDEEYDSIIKKENKKNRQSKIEEWQERKKKVSSITNFLDINVDNVWSFTKEEEIKIYNYASRYGRDIEELKNKMINDYNIYADVLMKDAKKQNIIENHQIEELTRKYPNYYEKNKYILQKDNDNKVSMKNAKDNMRDRSKESKSIDITINGNEHWFLRYTKDNGGGQDNAYKEVLSFIKLAVELNDNKHTFYIVIEGKYYTDKKIKEVYTLKNENENIRIIPNLSQFLNDSNNGNKIQSYDLVHINTLYI